LQTILGAGGAIGTQLAKALSEYTKDIRLVSRNPKKVNESDQLLPADLTKKEDMQKAVDGSSVVYITIGFPYNVKSWQKNWPVFIENIVNSCKEYNCKLVFVDNIYMYNPSFLENMTETTPINPSSKKGKMFGADCIKSANGKVAAVLWKDSILFKLDETSQIDALKIDGAKTGTHLYDSSKPMKGWVSIPFQQSGQWIKFAIRAIHFVDNRIDPIKLKL